jgi:hypothetical protein
MNDDKKIVAIRDSFHDAVLEHLRVAIESLKEELSSRRIKSEPGSGPSYRPEPEWTPISSLSQLRTEVGGRFENLKKRWEQAGFPLRAHRGEELGEFSVIQEGWLELSSWLHKQGFENRLEENAAGIAFSIRRMGPG